jgi:predicted secreted hydrolase
MAVDLTFTQQMPGFKLGDGIIRFDGQVALAWVVPMPRASVEGTIREGGEVRHVRGMGYHDHNWGELNLTDTMAYWYWGRITSPESTLVYADVHFQPSLGVRPFSFVVSGDASHMTRAVGDATFEPQEVRYLDPAGREVPKALAIRANGLSLDLHEDQVLEADNFSVYIPWVVRPWVRLATKPAYVRSLSSFVLTEPGAPPIRGTGGITEFMYVRQP